jgi:amidase
VRLLAPTDAWALAVPQARPSLEQARARVQAALGPAQDVQVVLGSFEEMYWAFRRIQGHGLDDRRRAHPPAAAAPLGPGAAERFAFSRPGHRRAGGAGAGLSRRLRAHLAALGADSMLVLPTMPDIAPLRSEPESAPGGLTATAPSTLLCIAGPCGLPAAAAAAGRARRRAARAVAARPAGSDASLVALAQRGRARGLSVAPAA